MIRALFLNENALGHSSYLPVFAKRLQERPEWGVIPDLIDVAPLPDSLEALAAPPFRGAGRLGWNTHYRRWRELASRYAVDLLRERVKDADVVVVNTQSVALDLPSFLPQDLPLVVCLDATFAQLRRTPWFFSNIAQRILEPLTIGDLLTKEASLFSRATKLFAWSSSVAESLRNEYRIDSNKISLLPPSLDFPVEPPPERKIAGVPRILFLGGDFQRKGGPLLLDCYRRFLRHRAALDIVTQTEIEAEDGVKVYRNVRAHTPLWRQIWEGADLFVFPSRLETFGIVLLEAHCFAVPVVASSAGAAKELLDDGKAGWLLPDLGAASLGKVLVQALDDAVHRRRRALHGFELARKFYSLEANTNFLADSLRQFTGVGRN